MDSVSIPQTIVHPPPPSPPPPYSLTAPLVGVTLESPDPSLAPPPTSPVTMSTPGATPTIQTPTAQTPHVMVDVPFGDLDGELASLAANTTSVSPLKEPKQFVVYHWSQLQSWGSFIDTQKMKVPPSIPIWSRRLLRNLGHFRSNYTCVFLILIVYCILTSPLLLLALLASIGMMYVVFLRNSEAQQQQRAVKWFGYPVTLGHQLGAVCALSFPLLYIAGAGHVVFWVIGASFFVIGLHASIYAIEGIENDPLVQGAEYPPSAFNVQVV